MMSMTRHIFYGIVTMLLMPAFCLAGVTEVTLFPDSAKVSETAKLIPQCDKGKCSIVITLPPQADPKSLMVSAGPESRVRIDDVQIKPIPSHDDAHITDLRKQWSAAEEQKREIKAKIQALDAQIQFWQAQTKAKTKTVTDSYKLADAIGRNIQKISHDKLNAEVQMGKIEKNIKKLQEELNQAAGKKESAWETRLILSNASAKDTIFYYTYLLAGCGWHPLYRLEALPGKKEIAFSWEAEIWQSSGNDWKQVQLYLATLQPVMSIEPPSIPEWIIRPRSLYRSSHSKAALTVPAESAEQDEVLPEKEYVAATPLETKNTTYSLWSLGKKDIAAGDRLRLKIKDERWPAEFLFLARPSVSQDVFLRASVKLEQPAEIPPGQAIVVIDGAIIDKRDFFFYGSEGELFFGTSPLVSVSSTTVANQSGVKSPLHNRQTKSWQWQIEAKNSGNTDIHLRLEEPIPQARDKRIKLRFTQNPEVTEKDHDKFVWLMDVPAKQKKIIQNTIELEAPAEMSLDFGWR